MSREYAGICIFWYMYPSHKFFRALSTFSMYMYVFYVCEYNWLRYVLKINPIFGKTFTFTPVSLPNSWTVKFETKNGYTNFYSNEYN